MLDDRRAQDRCNADAASFSASSENLEEFMRRLNIKDNQRGQNADINPYPHRPDEPNCSYFIRTGQCGYGSHCRFNHPPPIGKVSTFGGELPERPGQPDCQFFLKTGTCKFGATCKYHHPCDKLMQLQVSLNTLGLPLRQEEKPCSYYMRNGSCKFGFACKFHHPEPAMGTVFHEASSSSYGFSGSTVASQSSMFPFLGGNPPWMPLQQSLYLTAQNSLGFPAFIPGIISPSHDVAAGQQAWGIYVGGMSSTDIPAPDYQHPYLKPQRQLSSVPLGLLPERPDQPDCQYFLKTGRCKYGSACKYHHPREKTSFSIGPHMLPLRPGQAACTFYTTYGSCKYGSTCKFDHPYTLAGYYGGYSVYPSLSTLEPSSSLFPYEGRSQTITPALSSNDGPEAFNSADGGIKTARDSPADEDHTLSQTLSPPPQYHSD